MRIRWYIFCFYTCVLVSSDVDWVSDHKGLVLERTVELSLHTLTLSDLRNLCSLNTSAHKSLTLFFDRHRLERKKLFHMAFSAPSHTIWAITADNKIKNNWVCNNGKVEDKISCDTFFRFSRAQCKALIVQNSFLIDRFGAFVYALEVSQDENKKLSLARVKFPLSASSSIKYVEKQQIKDNIFSTGTESFNLDDKNKIVCRADEAQQRLVTLFFNTDVKHKKNTVHLFIIEPLKASYYYAHDVSADAEISYPSQENLFKDDGILAYVFHRQEPLFFNSYYFDANTKVIDYKEHFFTLEKPQGINILSKQSFGLLTHGLITQMLKWPIFHTLDMSITHCYDEHASSIPKELVEIYLNFLRNAEDQHEKMDKNDLLQNVRIAQASILLSALNGDSPICFPYGYVLDFLKKITAMRHSENSVFYRDFNGQSYYTEENTTYPGDLRAFENNSIRPLSSDAVKIINAWVLALDHDNKDKNKAAWLARHAKEAMAFTSESFFKLCQNVALQYAKRSWANNQVGVAWDKEPFSKKSCFFRLYELKRPNIGVHYYDSDSIDIHDSITNVVYKSENDVEFYFTKSGKYRCSGSQRLVRCND